jgi:hypothetical protein
MRGPRFPQLIHVGCYANDADERIMALSAVANGVQKGYGAKCGSKIDISGGKMRKKCVVRAIPTIDHTWLNNFLRVSTVFSVGI